MKIIKIYFTDFSSDFDINDNDFIKILRNKYEVILAPKDPDYLFYSTFGKKYLEYDCIRIFYTGECITPDFNICDYAIGFDRISFGDRYLRLPLYRLFQYRKYYEMIFEREPILSIDNSKQFCSFVYSNCFADDMRLKMFKELSKYKKVDSGGRFMNNVGGSVTDKFAFQSKHKFSISFENVCHDGYVTEKLVDALASRTIPIYMGDPRIDLDFNDKAFINGNKYNSINEIIDRVKEIDNNPKLYLEMLNENPIVNDKRNNTDLIYFLDNIFMQSPKEAFRRPNSRWSLEIEASLRRHRWYDEKIIGKYVRLKKIIYRIKNNAI